jgi:hypothetical protein
MPVSGRPAWGWVAAHDDRLGGLRQEPLRHGDRGLHPGRAGDPLRDVAQAAQVGVHLRAKRLCPAEEVDDRRPEPLQLGHQPLIQTVSAGEQQRCVQHALRDAGRHGVGEQVVAGEQDGAGSLERGLAQRDRCLDRCLAGQGDRVRERDVEEVAVDRQNVVERSVTRGNPPHAGSSPGRRTACRSRARPPPTP